jgi:hypothetical protein
VQVNERQAMNGQQLELTLEGRRPLEPMIPGRISQDRAAWWFDRIHSRLQRALRPTPAARHEQERLELVNAGDSRWFRNAPRWGGEAPVDSQALERAA